jgi:hypothetical protein
MFGIEQLRMDNAERLIVLSTSRAPSGRGDFYGMITQGIVLTHSALGWVLMAFQAIPPVTLQTAN